MPPHARAQEVPRWLFPADIRPDQTQIIIPDEDGIGSGVGSSSNGRGRGGGGGRGGTSGSRSGGSTDEAQDLLLLHQLGGAGQGQGHGAVSKVGVEAGGVAGGLAGESAAGRECCLPPAACWPAACCRQAVGGLRLPAFLQCAILLGTSPPEH